MPGLQAGVDPRWSEPVRTLNRQRPRRPSCHRPGPPAAIIGDDRAIESRPAETCQPSHCARNPATMPTRGETRQAVRHAAPSRECRRCDVRCCGNCVRLVSVAAPLAPKDPRLRPGSEIAAAPRSPCRGTADAACHIAAIAAGSVRPDCSSTRHGSLSNERTKPADPASTGAGIARDRAAHHAADARIAGYRTARRSQRAVIDHPVRFRRLSSSPSTGLHLHRLPAITSACQRSASPDTATDLPTSPRLSLRLCRRRWPHKLDPTPPTAGLTGSGQPATEPLTDNRGGRIEHRRGRRHRCRDGRSLAQTRTPQIVRAEAAASSPSVQQTGPSPPLAKASAATRNASVPAANATVDFRAPPIGGSCRRTARSTGPGGSRHVQNTGQPWAADRRDANPGRITARFRKPDDGGTGRPRHRRWRTDLAVGTSCLADCNRCRADLRRRPVRHRRLPPRHPGGHIAHVETRFAGGADGARPGVAGPYVRWHAAADDAPGPARTRPRAGAHRPSARRAGARRDHRREGRDPDAAAARSAAVAARAGPGRRAGRGSQRDLPRRLTRAGAAQRASHPCPRRVWPQAGRTATARTAHTRHGGQPADSQSGTPDASDTEFTPVAPLRLGARRPRHHRMTRKGTIP